MIIFVIAYPSEFVKLENELLFGFYMTHLVYVLHFNNGEIKYR